MIHHKIKDLRIKNKLTQDDMAATLNISQNAYSLIENGVTRLVDIERIKLIAERFGVNPVELGLLDGLGLTQNFNEKVENGYASYIQTLNADNKELLQTLKEELQMKNNQMEHLITQNAELIQLLIVK